jgi:hypothetical protein
MHTSESSGRSGAGIINGVWKMLNQLRKQCGHRPFTSAHTRLLLILASILLIMFSQSACSKKGKASASPPTAVKMAILPFGIPPGNQDLRWTAMAGPIVMGKVSANAQDLIVLPLWQTMPTAVEAAGEGRSFSPETSAQIAAWLGVKWSAMGEFSPTKTGVRMMIDFIPSKTTAVPFRYTKSGKLDAVGERMPEVFVQFLRYLTLRPLIPVGKNLPTMTSYKTLAEALDREYGWFVPAEPGKAQDIVADLARKDDKLARLLFNPAIYPALALAK